MVRKIILNIFFIIIENSSFEILFVCKNQNSNDAGNSLKSKKSFLDNENKLFFPNEIIQFDKLSVEKDIIDVFLLYNENKVKSTDSQLNNYYRIVTKNIGIKDNFEELTFNIVNDIQLKIKIKIKNKISTQRSIYLERIKFFNSKVEQNSSVQPKYIHTKKKSPKKLKNEVIIKHEDETKKEEPPKEIIKEEKPKNEETVKEQNKTEKEIQKNEQEKEEIKLEEKKEEVIVKDESKNNSEEYLKEKNEKINEKKIEKEVEKKK